MNNKKFTLKELIWYGFNYVTSITFTLVFYTLIWGRSGHQADNVGIHLLWIMAIVGIVATACAMCFGKLSKVHTTTNGGAYSYTRTQFGKFMGWLILFLQYMSLPISIMSQIISMVSTNFANPDSFLFVGGLHNNNFDFIHGYWGHWSSLILDIIGIIVYAISASLIFLGLKKFKKLIHGVFYLKWIFTFILIIGVSILFFINISNSGQGTNNLVNLAKHHSNITVGLFANVFASTFFFFGGTETYITIGKNVEKPEKNIARAILIIMLISTVFYLLTTLLFMGAFSEPFSTNPNIQAFRILGIKFHAVWIEYIGVIFMLFATIALRFTSGMQNGLYSGAIIEPQAKEGFVSENLGEVDQDGIAIKASKFNLIITLIFAVVWLLIPDLIQGFSDKQPFSYSAISGEGGIFMMFLYLIVVSICIKLAWLKKIEFKFYEFILWILLIIFLSWQVYEFFATDINGIYGTLHQLPKYANDQLATYLIQLLYLLFTAILLFGIYWFYYLPKYHKRLKEDPKIQKILDDEFRMIDDWVFVSESIEDQLDDYLVRIKNIGIKIDKTHYNTVIKLKKMLIKEDESNIKSKNNDK